MGEIRRFPRLPVKRFPRLPEGCTLEDAPRLWRRDKKTGELVKYLTKTERAEKRVADGDLPRGYDRLTHHQKRVIRYIASGYTIDEACKKGHMGRETFYRLRRAHPLFRTYLNKQVASNLTDIQVRHGRQVLRASQVIDEGLDMGDPYLATDIAKAVLKGRGEWKNSSQVDAKHSGSVGVVGELKVDDMGLTKELMATFVNGLVNIVSNTPTVDERKMKILTVGDNGALPAVKESERATAP